VNGLRAIAGEEKNKVKLRCSERHALGVLAVLIVTLSPAATAQATTTPRKVTSPARALALSALRHDSALAASGRRGGGRPSVRRRLDAKRAPRARASVVGGSPTSIEQVPWQVAVFTKFEDEGKAVSELCGGSIVRDMSHVLTAGQCAYDPFTGEPLPAKDLSVVAGVSNISEKEISEGPTSQARTVGSVRVHPYFEGPGAPDDIAELELESPLQPSTAVGTVGLPATSALPPEGKAVSLSGFGEESPAGEELDSNLNSLGETLGFGRQCGGEANALFLCASSPVGTACGSDTGGPLLAAGSQELIGVVDTVAFVGGQNCAYGAEDGFANVTAPEILDFVNGSEAPPRAPQGGGAVIRGFIEVGRSLTCEPGIWSGEPAFAYAFVDSTTGGALQEGASPSYPLTSSDRGRAILCQVYATNTGGTGLGRTPALPPIVEARRTGSSLPAQGGGAPAAVEAPSGGGGVLGSTAEGIGRSQIAALLKRALAPSGKSAKLASLARAGSVTLKFDAPEAGTVSIDWYRAGSAHAAAAKPLLVAAGHKTSSGRGAVRVRLVLTSAGKRALRGHSRVALTAKGKFTPSGAASVAVVKNFVLAG
jgi:trypsin